MKFAGLVAAVALVASGCLLILPIDRPGTSDSPSSTMGSAGAAGSGTGMGGGGGGTGSDAGCLPECLGPDVASICREGQCVQLTTPECIVVRGNWRDPNAVFLGGYALLPREDPEGSTTVWDYELAVDELNSKGGLPDVNGTLHPLVIVICTNDASAPGVDTLPKSLSHLVDEVGVPAIVADLEPQNLIRAFQMTVAKSKQVFFLSPGAATNELVALKDDDLVWHMTGSVRDLAPAYQSLVSRLEKLIKKDATPLKVAVVKTNDPGEPFGGTLRELIEVVRPRLQFNSRDLAANQSAGYYQEFDVDAGQTPQDVSAKIVAYEPHVVISMLGPRFTNSGAMMGQATGVAASIEQTLGPNRVRPYYILNPINAASLGAVSELLKGFLQVFPTMHERFLGLNVAGADDTRLYHAYLDRLRSAFPRARDQTENFYDPIYYLAYSMYVAGVEQRLDGTHIRGGMAHLLLGKVFDVGPIPIPDVFGELRNRPSTIQLVGTMGPPFFESGARKGRGALYCFQGTDVAHLQEQVYDPGTNTWSGTFSCYNPPP